MGQNDQPSAHPSTKVGALHHLACLLDCGLVSREQRGRYVYYQLGDQRVAHLLGLAEAVLADAARGLYECSRFRLPEHGEGG